MRQIFTLSLLFVNLFIHQWTFAAIFTVTSAGGGTGTGTFRRALLDAAANGSGLDTINFNITPPPLTAPFVTINFPGPIPVNTPVFINGYSQNDAAPDNIQNRKIRIAFDFYNSFDDVNNDGLIISSGNVTVRGIAITKGSRGIVITSAAGVGAPVKIQGCHIGVSSSAIGRFPEAGINFGNLSHGIFIEETSSGFVIPRVFIGTDGDGNNDVTEGNLISNNGGDGIQLEVADHTVIAGNYIGTDKSGNVSSNFDYTNNNGITLNGNNIGDGAANNRIGSDGNGVSDAEESNLISGNRYNGILIQQGSTNNIVAGNSIGLDLLGSTNGAPNGIGTNPPTPINFPTDGNGIALINVSGNRIGLAPGTGVAAQRNIIGANIHNGILLYSSSGLVQNNTIMGNTIGLNQAGTPRGNGRWGVFLSNASGGTLVSNNLIGSDDNGIGDALEGNIITANKRDGIGLFQNLSNSVVSNRISRNSMYGNTSSSGTEGFGLGINLMTSMTDGTTVNQSSTDGPNNLLNYPEITNVWVDPTAQRVLIRGKSVPGRFMQFYIASSDVNQDNPAFNEGQAFLFSGQEGGPEDLSTFIGEYSFLMPYSQLAAAIADGNSVVGLSHGSTSGAANTSEFSPRILVTLAVLPVQLVNFNAALRNNEVLVTWSTANEQNASHFDVERSSNGTDFNRIGTVKARGNSNSLVNYSHSDANPLSGVSYYRLRQVDLDNRFSYSKTVVVRNDADGRAFSVWPNPVLDNMNITLTSDRNQNLNLRVVDPNGRVVRNQVVHASKGMNQITVNMNTLTKGMYLVQVVGENLNLSERVIKQ
jgi:hypothetical protein